MSTTSVEFTLGAIEGYLARKADMGDEFAKNLHELLTPLLSEFEGTRDFTVLASVANQGTLKVFHVSAVDGYQAFGKVAHAHPDDDLEFLASLVGRHDEGTTFNLPGEGIVCAETVREQEDIFGPAPKTRSRGARP